MELVQNIDYNIQGYFKVNTIDYRGDLITVEYYRNYDGETYSNMKVKESRTYTRDANGILSRRDMLIEWFKNGGDTVMATKNTIKYYTVTEGYEDNKRSRTNIINKASMYLMGQIGVENGKAFLNISKSEINGYISGSIQPLLDLVANTTEVYMIGSPPVIKETLNYILNVEY